MAQYDLLLTQNVAPTGFEFSEKYVNLPKGALLSGDAGGVPTALTPGTNNFMLVRDDAETTGLKWVEQPAGHAQGTDDGTTSTVFELDTDGYKIELTAENAGKFGVKVDGGAAYADLQAKDATFNSVTVAAAPTLGSHLANKTYVDGILAANDAMVYKGTIGTGGTHTIASFNALTTYNAGWTYRVIEAGTIRGNVCQIGDLITVLVDRSGTGNVDADFTALQTNIDGAVVGPASSTDNYVALFSGTSGKLLKAGSGVLGSAAYTASTAYATAAQGTTADGAIQKSVLDAESILYATVNDTPAALAVGASTFVGRKATGSISAMTVAEAKTLLAFGSAANNNTGDFATAAQGALADGAVQKSLYDANSILAAVTDNNPAVLSVAEQTMIGRKTGGNIAALTPAEIMNVIWVTAPASKTATGTAGQIARDANWFYVCTAANVWKRSAIATNW